MADDRLETRDWKVLLLWLLIGVAGAGVAFKYFFAAFPEASIDFRVSRPAAVEVARNFLAAQGFKLDGYDSTIVFAVDDDAKTYLEREVGLEQANRLMSTEVSVWYWSVRFFRPRQKEEFHMRVSPAGRVVGMTHIIEEARPGASLERDSARACAENFLNSAYGVSLASYDFLTAESNSTERPKRRDWSFTWERHGFKAPARENGAPYRLRVTLQGEQIGGAEEFLKVPEAWQRDYQRLRSSNIFYEYIALVPYGLLYGALFWVLFDLGRRGLLRWGGALKLGLLVAVLFFINSVNEWPLTRSGYDTNSSYSGFLASHMVEAALFSLLAGLSVTIAMAAAEPLYRRNQPEQLRLGVAFRIPGIRSKEFFRSCIIGLTMAAGHIGLVVLFYLIGGKFGVWAPQEVNYTNVVSTSLPWILPLTIGVYAATSEEFMFRLFAIPLLLRFTRSRFLAVVLPAFAWGFLHSSYPQEPGYIRGIEVGLIGIVAGVVMLRWGILATLVWHYTVDALLISLFLLRSGSLYFRVSGALVGAAVLIPLGIAAALYLVRGRFETDESLLNRAEPLVEAPAEPEAAPVLQSSGVYQALSARGLGILLACGAVGALLLVGVKAQNIGDFVRIQINAREAGTRADEVIRQMRNDPASWRRVVRFVNNFDPYANEYLRRQVGIAGANKIYQEKVASAFWRVRYFRDSQKEEYAVILRTDGALHSVHHMIEEKAPGANVAKEAAQAHAEAYLRDVKKLDLAKWKLVEATSDKRPARTDHTFTWEELEAIGEAHVRMEVKVLGDTVFGYRIFVKIPEEWERKQTETTLAGSIHLVVRILFYAGLAITVLVIFFKNLRQQKVPWRRLLGWASWGLLASAVASLSVLPQILSNYPTEFPLKTFAVIIAISLFFIVTLTGGAIFFLFGLAWFFLAQVYGEARLPAWKGMSAAYYRDAFLVALGGSGALLGMARAPFLVDRVWPTARKLLEASVPMGLEAYYPAAQAIGGAVSHGLLLTSVIALVAGFLASYVRPAWMRWGLLVVFAIVRVGAWGSPTDFAKQVLAQVIFLAIVWWGVASLVRFNLLGYFLLIACGSLVSAAVPLLQQPNQFFRANGYAVVGALLVLLVVPLIAWLSRAASNGGPTQSSQIAS